MTHAYACALRYPTQWASSRLVLDALVALAAATYTAAQKGVVVIGLTELAAPAGLCTSALNCFLAFCNGQLDKMLPSSNVVLTPADLDAAGLHPLVVASAYSSAHLDLAQPI
ncbi:hypothetical protein JCM11251_007403 [Rhodosporidiobolus azoricus]